MFQPPLRRLAGLVLALVLVGATSAVPLHSHVDHTAQEQHVDTEHGGHDGILLHETDDRAAGSKIVLNPARVGRFFLVLPCFRGDAREDPVQDPPFHPPNGQSRPRAPPPLI